MDATLLQDEDAESFCSEPAVTFSPEDVYHQHAPRVYNLARKMVNNDDDAEDITQDVLLQVVRKLPTFRGESALPTWLHRVTVNAALQHRRKKAVRDDVMHHTEEEDLLEGGQPRSDSSWMSTPDEQLEARELSRLIHRAIKELPEKYRKVFILSELEGQPNAEIAQLLDISLPAVKSRIHRARSMMKERLSPYFEELGISSE